MTAHRILSLPSDAGSGVATILESVRAFLYDNKNIKMILLFF
jgi:hypothetical protein